MQQAENRSTPTALAGTSAGLFRRFMAMVYDSLLLIALFAIVSLPMVLQFDGEQAITSNPFMLALYRLVLLLTAFLFFGWFWTHGGQTLGMRAWRLQAVNQDGTSMDWIISGKRFLAALLSLACLGLGYLWILFDRDKLAWHDRLSRTRIILLPKKSS